MDELSIPPAALIDPTKDLARPTFVGDAITHDSLLKYRMSAPKRTTLNESVVCSSSRMSIIASMTRVNLVPDIEELESSTNTTFLSIGRRPDGENW